MRIPRMVALTLGLIKMWTHPGNAFRYAPQQLSPENSILNGKRIIFLGSSVTYGACSRGNSFVEYLAAQCGIQAVKEAVSGTTLVTLDNNSYIPRMKKLDCTQPADCFVCQLSTNDATHKLPLGQMGTGWNKKEFDCETISGAIEYIIAYAQETWSCPVVFYTNPPFDSNSYQSMMARMRGISGKWEVPVIDLWDDPAYQNMDEKQYRLWMMDDVHPTMAGYRNGWLPVFRRSLEHILEGS